MSDLKGDDTALQELDLIISRAAFNRGMQKSWFNKLPTKHCIDCGEKSESFRAIMCECGGVLEITSIGTKHNGSN